MHISMSTPTKRRLIDFRVPLRGSYRKPIALILYDGYNRSMLSYVFGSLGCLLGVSRRRGSSTQVVASSRASSRSNDGPVPVVVDLRVSSEPVLWYLAPPNSSLEVVKGLVGSP